MSLVFAAAVPHPPLLIPAIGKENLTHLKATIDAFRRLEEELYASQPDTILIISPHGSIQSNYFTMNLSPEFTVDFRDFGDFSTKARFSGDVGLSYKMRENLETKVPLQLISEPKLDHGCSVPLFLLTQKLPKIKIIPIYYSGLPLDAHFIFGQFFNREISFNKQRIAVIASGDLSHRLTKSAPAGYSPKGKKFDQKVVECMVKNSPEDLLGLNESFIADAGECGLKSIMILLGILRDVKCQPSCYSYEGPFGVGYAVVNFNI